MKTRANMTYRCVIVVLAGFALAGCGGSSDSVGGDGTLPSGSRGDNTVREQCVERGSEVQALDANNDGRPDVRHVLNNGVRRCSEFDMNFDGQADVTRFYEADGETPAREEHDLDFDGRLDHIGYFEAGVLVRKELDTNFDNRIDTWMWCEEGRVGRAERDRSNDGDVDTWESYEVGLLTESAYDDNHDGEPEKWEVFRNGRLIEIRHDTDRDGRPDRSEEIPEDSAGPPEGRLNCQLMDDPEPEPAPTPPPPPASTEGDSSEGDSSEGTSDGDAPFPDAAGGDEV